MTRYDAFSNCTRNARAGKRVNRKLPSSPVIASYSPTRAKLGHTSYASSVLTGMALHDPEEWAPEFQAWVLHQCIFRDCCTSSTDVLHAGFCDWCLSNRSVPCRNDTFEELLKRTGFCVNASMVHGLILKIDFQTLVTH
jgi:hypothetical protein